MKQIIILLLVAIAMAGCEKEYSRDRGQITGLDPTMCACCGGFFITIDDNIYRMELPEGTEPDFLDEPFPIDVRLTWKNSEGTGCENFHRITVEKIKKI